MKAPRIYCSFFATKPRKSTVKQKARAVDYTDLEEGYVPAPSRKRGRKAKSSVSKFIEEGDSEGPDVSLSDIDMADCTLADDDDDNNSGDDSSDGDVWATNLRTGPRKKRAVAGSPQRARKKSRTEVPEVIELSSD